MLYPYNMNYRFVSQISTTNDGYISFVEQATHESEAKKAAMAAGEISRRRSVDQVMYVVQYHAHAAADESLVDVSSRTISQDRGKSCKYGLGHFVDLTIDSCRKYRAMTATPPCPLPLVPLYLRIAGGGVKG